MADLAARSSHGRIDDVPARPPERRPGDAFDRARRHSRRVRLLKIGLPAVATVMVVIGIGAAYVARSLPGELSFASSTLEDGRLVMQDPRLSGSDSRDRPYSMTARRAIQSVAGSTSGVDLEGVRADIAVDDSTNATVQAGNGFYDVASERLRLFDDIEVDTTSGIAIRLSQAEIDLGQRSMQGQGPVVITTPNQRLESGSVVIEEGGERLSFGGRVKLTLLPSASDDANAGANP